MSGDAPDVEFLPPLIDLTRKSFLNKHGIPPVFLMEKNGDIQPIMVPSNLVNSEAGKDDLANLMEAAVNSFKPDSHCFISEAWMYKMADFDNKEDALKALEDFKSGIPCDNIQKIEGLVFSFTKINSDSSTEKWVGTMPFHRDSADKISSFEPMKWIKQEGEHTFEGRFV